MHPPPSTLLNTSSNASIAPGIFKSASCAAVPHVNAFLEEDLNPLLNFHRPCNFPTEIVTPSSRRKLKYRQQDIVTPYDKLKSLPDAHLHLRPGVTFAQLDRIALKKTDLEAGEDTQKALAKLHRANRRANAKRAATTA